MATTPTEQMRGARKSGHAGAMADARQSVSAPAIYVPPLTSHAYNFNTDRMQRGTNKRAKSCGGGTENVLIISQLVKARATVGFIPASIQVKISGTGI